MDIRNYKAEDYSAIEILLKEANMFDEVWDSRENLAGIVKYDPENIIIALQGEQIVGLVFLIPYGTKVLYLFRLVVRKDVRQKGIGTAILNYVRELAKRKGIEELGFYVDASNSELKEFYVRQGFATSNKHWVYMWKKI